VAEWAMMILKVLAIIYTNKELSVKKSNYESDYI
jgi:hypothetical protein